MLKKIISGGQTGSDVGALKAAKAAGLETGGSLPKGWITQDGPRPEYEFDYGMTEDSSSKYPPRTEQNVINSDGTVRFASNFNSAGEKCTLKFIVKHNKPYFDVDINNPQQISIFALWIANNDIKTLNVAGNSEKTSPGIEQFVIEYLSAYLTSPKPKPRKAKVRVHFVGERDFEDYDTLINVFSQCSYEIDEIVIGDSTGTDILAEKFALAKKIPVRKICTEWDNLEVPGAVVKTGKFGPYNSRAAFDKNQKIAEHATHAIVLQQSGMNVNDMLNRFKKLSKEVFATFKESEGHYEF